MAIIYLPASGVVHAELGGAVIDWHSPVRRSRFAREQARRQWGEREMAPEGVAEVSC